MRARLKLLSFEIRGYTLAHLFRRPMIPLNFAAFRARLSRWQHATTAAPDATTSFLLQIPLFLLLLLLVLLFHLPAYNLALVSREANVTHHTQTYTTHAHIHVLGFSLTQTHYAHPSYRFPSTVD